MDVNAFWCHFLIADYYYLGPLGPIPESVARSCRWYPGSLEIVRHSHVSGDRRSRNNGHVGYSTWSWMVFLCQTSNRHLYCLLLLFGVHGNTFTQVYCSNSCVPNWLIHNVIEAHVESKQWRSAAVRGRWSVARARGWLIAYKGRTTHHATYY